MSGVNNYWHVSCQMIGTWGGPPLHPCHPARPKVLTRPQSRSVAADTETVWAILGDFDGISRWAGAVSHSSPLTSPATGLGSVRRVQVGREALREQVVVWEPPHRLTYTIEGLPAVVLRARTTWTLTAEGTGTRVTISSEVTTRPPLLARLVARRLAAECGRLLADLVEQHHQSQREVQP